MDISVGAFLLPSVVLLADLAQRRLFRPDVANIHYIRKLEKEAGYTDILSACDDPFCIECYGKISLEIVFETRERIVDGYLVTIPRAVPDDAMAYAQIDPITENIIVFWNWATRAGKDITLKSMVAKKRVEAID